MSGGGGAFKARRSALRWRSSPLSLLDASSGYDNPEALRWPACPTPDSEHALRQRPLVPDPQRRAVARRGDERRGEERRGREERRGVVRVSVDSDAAVSRRTSMDWSEVPTFSVLTGEERELSACSSFLLRPQWHRGVRVGCGCACGSVCWVRVCARPRRWWRRRTLEV